MLEFPKSITDGDIVLDKLPATFDVARQMFDIINKNRDFFGQWLPWVEFIKSPEDEFAFVQKSAKTDNGSYYITQNKKIIGNVGFVKLSESNKSAEIGYWLVPEFNGRGIMTRAVKLLENQGFNMGLVRITIEADVENIPSQNVAVRCGYTREALLRKSFVLHGASRDMFLFSKLNTEWEKGK